MFDNQLRAPTSTQSALAEWLRSCLPGVLGISIWILLGVTVVITVIGPLGQMFARRAEPPVVPSIAATSPTEVATRNEPAIRR